MTRPNIEELDRLHVEASDGSSHGVAYAAIHNAWPSVSVYIRELEERNAKLAAAFAQACETAEEMALRKKEGWVTPEQFQAITTMRANRKELLK